MIRLENINLNYQVPILKDVKLSLSEGEILGLVGKSGAGKSSLLKIMAGLQDADSGSVYLDGKKQALVANMLIPGFKQVAIVNQDFKLDRFHTVAENIKEAILHWPDEKREKRVRNLLKLFQLQAISETKAHLISGGEQQRVAIARAIADKPRLLLLDEPFGHLDAQLRQNLSTYLMDLRDLDGTSIVLVSHEGQDVLGMCDAICMLRNGKLSKKFSPENVYYHFKTQVQGALFGPVNQLKLTEHNILFRPDEYKIASNGGHPLRFIRSVFVGGLYHNYFEGPQHERILLYAFEPLAHIHAIEICKK
ncbi:MAG: hypothetical protein RLZZ301_1006 [Bacteroidota bacterium]|jgi:iron(III) transport system ATP-binding protein